MMQDEGDEGVARLEGLLRAHWAEGGEPPDAGFSLRVMAALPAPRRRRGAGPAAARAAALCALALLGVAGGGLPLQSLGPVEQCTAGLVLAALTLWWSLPQSRGSQWH